MIHKQLSFDDEEGISTTNKVENGKIAKKAIPRSHLAEIIDEFEVDKDDIDDDVSEDIIMDMDDVDDDR